jgi:hypothetical protein
MKMNSDTLYKVWRIFFQGQWRRLSSLTRVFDPVWIDLFGKHSKQSFHVLVGSGDQLWQGNSWAGAPWLDETTQNQKWCLTGDIRFAIDRYYFNHYCQTWRRGACSEGMQRNVRAVWYVSCFPSAHIVAARCWTCALRNITVMQDSYIYWSYAVYRWLWWVISWYWKHRDSEFSVSSDMVCRAFTLRGDDEPYQEPLTQIDEFASCKTSLLAVQAEFLRTQTAGNRLRYSNVRVRTNIPVRCLLDELYRIGARGYFLYMLFRCFINRISISIKPGHAEFNSPHIRAKFTAWPPGASIPLHDCRRTRTVHSLPISLNFE